MQNKYFVILKNHRKIFRHISSFSPPQILSGLGKSFDDNSIPIKKGRD